LKGKNVQVNKDLQAVQAELHDKAGKICEQERQAEDLQKSLLNKELEMQAIVSKAELLQTRRQVLDGLCNKLKEKLRSAFESSRAFQTKLSEKEQICELL